MLKNKCRYDAAGEEHPMSLTQELDRAQGPMRRFIDERFGERLRSVAIAPPPG